MELEQQYLSSNSTAQMADFLPKVNLQPRPPNHMCIIVTFYQGAPFNQGIQTLLNQEYGNFDVFLTSTDHYLTDALIEKDLCTLRSYNDPRLHLATHQIDPVDVGIGSWAFIHHF